MKDVNNCTLNFKLIKFREKMISLIVRKTVWCTEPAKKTFYV